MSTFQPAGYLYKHYTLRPDWLEVPTIKDLYTISSCGSKDFADYIPFWRHNAYWLFDSPAIMEEIAQAEQIELAGLYLFFYECYPLEYDQQTCSWIEFKTEPLLTNHIVLPKQKALQGFDIVTFCADTSPECSPLSCNGLCDSIPTNEHCLMPTFEAAKQVIEQGLLDEGEPGPFRIFAVYLVEPNDAR